MANENNLKKALSPNEARENGRKGGIKSGQVRRKRKMLCELMEMALKKKDEKSGLSYDLAIVAALMKKAVSGDIQAAAFIRDTIGEKPVLRHEVMQIEPPVIVDDIQ
jgi:hypothetical protein